MANITITIPDAVVPRVLDAVSARNGYNTATDGTKAQFAKAVLVRWLKAEVVGYEKNKASEEAADSAGQLAKNEIAIS